MLCGILVVMVRIDLTMTLITLAVAPLFFATISAFGKRIETASKRYHESETSLVGAAQEALTSMRAVQAFTMESAFGVRFRDQAGTSLRAHEQLMRSQLAFSGVVGIAMALGTAAVIWIGVHRLEEGRLLVGDVLVFLAYLGMLYQPVNAFCQSAGVFRTAVVQLKRVFEVVDAVSAVADKPGATVLESVGGKIEFRAVSFHYEPNEPVLRDISLVVPEHSVIAVVGRTGAGKTTLASLLMRFYDPVSELFSLMAMTCATCSRTGFASRSASSFRTRFFSLPLSGRISPPAAPAPLSPKFSLPPAARKSMRTFSVFQVATIRCWASEA
jgi:ABC-type multidrug transport system fused ATPase/permease subunit